jgi:hypothetical protein
MLRRQLEIFFNFTRATGHSRPHLQVAVDNRDLFDEIGHSGEQILSTQREMAPKFFE